MKTWTITRDKEFYLEMVFKDNLQLTKSSYNADRDNVEGLLHSKRLCYYDSDFNSQIGAVFGVKTEENADILIKSFFHQLGKVFDRTFVVKLDVPFERLEDNTARGKLEFE